MLETAEYSVLDPKVRWNPHPVYARMRTEAPAYKMQHFEMGDYPWLLTRYDDCEMVQTDPRFTKDFVQIDPSGTYRNSPAAAINRHMLMVDPPDHTRLRGLVHKAFTPKMIAMMTERIQAITDGLLDAMQGQQELDFIANFALPLPMMVIADLLGIPGEDRAKFRKWSHTILMASRPGKVNMEDIATSTMEFMMYFHALFDQRRAEPRDDLVTSLVLVEEAGDRLNAQELISMIFLLILAGHETTVNLLANGTLSLLIHPDQLKLLKEDSTLIKSAVEEMLRFESPVSSTSMRWALEDVELRGQVIPKGEMVLASILGANRDPEVFENPDTFDIRRNPNKHMAFGYGIHYCLGAPLARMEGAIAINSLFRRFPNLQLATDLQSLQWSESLLVRSMEAMPVRLG